MTTTSSIESPKHSGSVSSVPLLDVSRGNGPLRDEILDAIGQVYDSGRFIHGPDCKQFEQSVAELCETSHAVGCASGSDALLLALMACDVGAGDEVVVPSFTFFATGSAVWRLGAKPVFAEIDPVTFNLDPASVEAAVTPATKAIIPVHMFGQCADMDAINEIAARHSLRVIEDAAQSIGAKFKGRPAGSMGHIGCFSFYPTKNLGGLGDGGILTTSDGNIAARIRLLASHGMEPKYHHSVVGVNSRLDSIQAAALNIKLRHLQSWADARRQNAERYGEMFSACRVTEKIGLPQPPTSGSQHVWNQYTVRVPDGKRDALRDRLMNASIGCEIYYPIPLHQQPCFQPIVDREFELPETERASAEVLSLPIFPELTTEEQQTVVQQVASFFNAESKMLARRLAS